MIREFLHTLNYAGLDAPARRRVFRHNLVTVGLAMALILSGLARSHISSADTKLVWDLVIVALIASYIAHGIYSYKTGQTYWSARIAEMRSARQAAQEGKAELLEFAAKLKRQGH